MLVPVDPHKLKPWLIRALEPISDAEPLVLADYVLALLKRDVRDLDELRHFCVHQLDDFLEQHSAAFVDSLLRALQDPDGSSSGPAARASAAAAPPPSLKRARSPQPAASSSSKLPRSHAGGSARSGARLSALPDTVMPAGPTSGRLPGRGAGQLLDRPPCRDYHYRGFCARGSACPYQHDALPPAQHLAPAFPPTFPPSFPLAPRPLPPAIRDGAPSSFLEHDELPRSAPFSSYPRPSGPPGRQAASAARPPRGTSRVITVDNIPPASLTDAAVRHFFQPFGPILQLDLDLEGRSATITFSAPLEADRALASPQAVFGNRFVRVYRTVDPGVGPSSSASGAGRQDDDGVAGAGARLDTAPPARQVDAHSRPGPASTIASTARARLLEQNAEQQRALLTEVQSAGAERKRGIMAALRDLAAKADELRKRTDPGLVEPAIGDPRARLLELQREAASLGIDTQGPPSRGADLLSRAGSARPRQSSRRHAQQFRLDNRSRNLLIGPLEQDAVLSSLRAHLELFGEVVALDYDPEAKTGMIEFALRKSAEQALAAGRLPQEFGDAKLSWAQGSTMPSASTASAPLGLAVHEQRQRSDASEARPDLARAHEDVTVGPEAEDEERSWNR